jgi:GTP-binding protein Era
LVGQKVAIVSPKAQTTRTRLMGIAIEGDAQLLLVDTPGIFDPARRLDRAMVAAAWEGAKDADLIALVVDGKGGVGPKVRALAESLKPRRERKLLILNKVDIADKPRLLGHAATLNELGAFDDTYFVSATTGDGVPVAELYAALAEVTAMQWQDPADSDGSDGSDGRGSRQPPILRWAREWSGGETLQSTHHDDDHGPTRRGRRRDPSATYYHRRSSCHP